MRATCVRACASVQRARACVRSLCQTTKPSLTQYWELGAAISRDSFRSNRALACLEFVLKPRRCQLSAALPDARSVPLPSRNEGERKISGATGVRLLNNLSVAITHHRTYSVFLAR